MEVNEGHPKLARGCRLRLTEQGDFLLMPESMLRMKGCGTEILKRCDGSRTVSEIVGELEAVYAGVERDKLAAEVASFLARLKEKLAIVEV
jgi:pyrroloquinoline quinone biosynthesis protein D